MYSDVITLLDQGITYDNQTYYINDDNLYAFEDWIMANMTDSYWGDVASLLSQCYTQLKTNYNYIFEHSVDNCFFLKDLTWADFNVIYGNYVVPIANLMGGRFCLTNDGYVFVDRNYVFTDFVIAIPTQRAYPYVVCVSNGVVTEYATELTYKVTDGVIVNVTTP